MEFKGTKGEWVIEDNCNEQTVITNEERNRAICFVPNLSGNSVADTNLIIAAPDLLYALKDLLNLIGKADGYCHQIIEAESAINKALGL